jgi:hypothetical protein
MALDLEAIQAQESPYRRIRTAALPATVRAARRKELGRRHSLAQQRALRALAKLHHDDYRSLTHQAFIQITDERGPLPGDEVA